MHAELLEHPHLSIISRTDDVELARIRAAIGTTIAVDGRADLERVLCELLAFGRSGTAKTLDLIGHSSATTSLLVLGDFVIDATSPTVTAFFRELADHNVLQRLGIGAVRLLGCLTADTGHGRWTVCALADILGVEVYGTTGLLLASHYNTHGFADERRYLLAGARELRANATVPRPLDRGEPSNFALDVDALPAVALPRSPWPVHVVGHEQAREMLALIRRRHGSMIPGLQSSPSCSVALPSSEPDRFHVLDVLLDGELVRVHPHGAAQPIVYPVDDPFTFRQLVHYASR
jgi:hypothetical protein